MHISTCVCMCVCVYIYIYCALHSLDCNLADGEYVLIQEQGTEQGETQ
jgi:hypothetical protein